MILIRTGVYEVAQQTVKKLMELYSNVSVTAWSKNNPQNYKGSSEIKISSTKHFLEISKTPSAITGLESKLLSKMGLLKCGVALTLTVLILCVCVYTRIWMETSSIF